MYYKLIQTRDGVIRLSYSEEAIRLHRLHKGKIAITPKVPLESMEDLSLAYSPGVAAVSMAIANDIRESYQLTNRANTVAVISDGSAVLGLGNIGPEAAMPVMEGKAALFKRFASIDAIPICLNTQDKDAIVETVTYLAPSFGGINLEDIAAPKCFEIEERLQSIGIPVFHDDQHGTAIVVLAGLINALNLIRKSTDAVKVVISGVGAAGIATAKLLHTYGIEDVVMVDSKGIVSKGRQDLNTVKQDILKITNPRSLEGGLENALKEADVFIGVSAPNIVTKEVIETMATDPIIFALSNPDPEILPELAIKAGAAIVGTGRSDYPNQINNCLAFPGIFRGALDSRCPKITVDMKIAAACALAELVAEPSADFIVPNSFNPSVVPAVSKAVAAALNN